MTPGSGRDVRLDEPYSLRTLLFFQAALCS
jgi:hypothetical protein